MPEFNQDPSRVSLEQAKIWLRKHFDHGASCPACNQFVKLYKRKLNASMAYVLVLIYRWHREQPEGHAEWLHVPSHIAKGGKDDARKTAAIRGDWAKLKHWGLIEEMPATRQDGSGRVGYYRITPQGIAFVRGQSAVQAYIWIYNETVINRPVTERVFIRDTLDRKFHYADLMAGV